MVASGHTTLMTVGLGSCVAVVLDDPAAGIGGVAHVVLPASTRVDRANQPGRYAKTAIPLLVERVVEQGGRRSRLRARLVGGATMFPELLAPGAVSLGSRNLAAVREILKELRIPVMGEDIGGNHGRSVAFHPSDGRLIVRSVRGPKVEL